MSLAACASDVAVPVVTDSGTTTVSSTAATTDESTGGAVSQPDVATSLPRPRHTTTTSTTLVSPPIELPADFPRVDPTQVVTAVAALDSAPWTAGLAWGDKTCPLLDNAKYVELFSPVLADPDGPQVGNHQFFGASGMPGTKEVICRLDIGSAATTLDVSSADATKPAGEYFEHLLGAIMLSTDDMVRAPAGDGLYSRACDRTTPELRCMAMWEDAGLRVEIVVLGGTGPPTDVDAVMTELVPKVVEAIPSLTTGGAA